MLWRSPQEAEDKGEAMTPAEQARCAHAQVQPTFDVKAAEVCDSYEVRRRWPRFMGECPDCKALLILYASTAHYVYGDW